MPALEQNWLESCLERVPQARVTVFGDFCLDAYWFLDPDEAERSVETGLPVRRVREQGYSLGGAGNIVANLAALGVRTIRAVGLLGDDLFGARMLDLLRPLGVDTGGLLQGFRDWQTPVYAKPCMGEAELNRIDFGAFNVPSPEALERLAARLATAAAASDVIVLNQQVPGGVSSAEMIGRLNALAKAERARTFLVDSRHRAELYQGCLLKLNAHEAARLLGEPRPLEERIPAALARELALRLFARERRPVFLTRGENGLLVADASGLHEEPGILAPGPTDPVGAGDTVLAALAAVLGSGGDPRTAARLANLAASLTVQKLHTTGTASPQELRAVGPHPDYVYLPELADDPRQARFAAGSQIEIVRDLPPGSKVRHAVFDHDGTLSTLREGWERIMEPMMIRAILGPRHDSVGEALYHKVVDTVRRFIDRTTGVQTLVQMQGLVAFVRQFGCVPEPEILDLHGYKARYNEELLATVRQRIAGLQAGELDPGDFQIKKAPALLEALHSRGVKLYLASGTDQQDVEAEARALGYAHLFEGRIFGAVGDVTVETKRWVLDRLFAEHGLRGPELATFGDGPVEIRETRKRGGIAVGVASDEVRRFGLNSAKRARLIRSGADLVLGDFRPLQPLLEILGLG